MEPFLEAEEEGGEAEGHEEALGQGEQLVWGQAGGGEDEGAGGDDEGGGED